MVITFDGLATIRSQNHDKKIVLTSGTFDLFHVGHLHYLQAVKTYGDIVVVMLSGDTRVKQRKSADRPIIPEDERAEILDALKVVDYVFIDPGKNTLGKTDPIYEGILADLQPDFYVTDGEDTRFSRIIDKSKLFILPRQASGKYGSTTTLLEHIARV